MSAEGVATLRAPRAPSLRALIEHALARANGGGGDPALAAQSLAMQIAAVRAAPATGAIPEHPWLRLADRLALSDTETIAGWLALLGELEPTIAARLRELQGDGRQSGASRPTLGLIARLVALLDGAHA